MSKQNALSLEGTVIEALANSMFRVELDNGHEVMCHNIRIMAGDRVRIAMSPYDLTKGRIEIRLK